MRIASVIASVFKIASIICICVLNTTVRCSAVEGETKGGVVRATLLTTKEVYVTYEPVIITARVVNATAATRGGFRSLSLSSGDLRLYIRNGSGDSVRLIPAVEEFIRGGRSELQPGELVESDVVVLRNYRDGRAAFPGPGTFMVGGEVELVSDGEKTALPLEEVPVVIAVPSRGDSAFLDSVGGGDAWMRLYERSAGSWCKGKPQMECFEGLRALVQDHPDSAYAPFLEYDLALSVGSGSLVSSRGPTEMIELLDEFLRRWPRHGLRPEVLGWYALALSREGNEMRSREILDSMVQEYPGRGRAIDQVRERIRKEAEGR